MNRKEFLVGLAAVGCVGLPEDGDAVECEWGRCVGLVALELRGKFEVQGVIEESDEIARNSNGRFVCVDLDSDEDWGELNPYEDSRGRRQVEYGNDESGYWHVARAYEFIGDGAPLCGNPTAGWREITLDDLADRVLVRMVGYVA